ncbi:unnamed protein product [Brugia timori]|uniref:Transposase n=1 Tax=Brugia timori TaxID=42155 RepID=A0A0R3QES2_9BILA|nr:unnamed protein product [Brugia timori]
MLSEYVPSLGCHRSTLQVKSLGWYVAWRKRNIHRDDTAREISRVVERAGTIRMEFLTFTLHVLFCTAKLCGIE